MHKTSQSILSSFMAIPRYLSLKYILSSNAFIIILLNASFITPASSQLGLLETSLEPTMPSGYYKQRLTQSSLVNKLRLVEAFKEKSMEESLPKAFRASCLSAVSSAKISTSSSFICASN